MRRPVLAVMHGEPGADLVVLHSMIRIVSSRVEVVPATVIDLSYRRHWRLMLR